MNSFLYYLKSAYIAKKERRKNLTPVQLKAKDNLFTAIAGVTVAVLLIAFSLLSISGRDRQYSENENRYLEAKPKFSLSSVFEGKYMQNMEAYLSDHFFARDAMVKTRTRLDIFVGKKEINGVYIGKKHFLFEKPAEYHAERVNATLQTMNEVTAANKKIPSYMALVPNGCEILSDLMPANAPRVSQKAQIDQIYGELKGMKGVDILSSLQQAKEPMQLYYRTDHHWTTEAARYAFSQLATDMKLDTGKAVYKDFCVTNAFQGTMASSAGLFSAKDSIYITVPEPDMEYVVTYVDENKKSATLFDSSKLQEKGKYEVFFGGNYAQVTIETTAKTNRVLLLIKDSYANCLVPMLLPCYQKIIMIDPRYYTDNLQQTIAKESPTEILWLYNVNTFLTDTSIASTFG